MKAFINVILYQLIWLLCVLGGNTGAMFALVVLLVHILQSERRAADLKMMGFLLFIGLLVDGSLYQVGFFSFAATGFPIPYWLMVIWLGLAITPHHSLSWLKNRPVLAMFFGALGGPVAYWGGVRLGAASFGWPMHYSLAILAGIWALLWPAVMHFSVISEIAADETSG